MPESLLGLWLLVVLLAPGFCFVARRNRQYPARSPSPLQEMAELAVLSVACNIAVLALLGLLRGVAPGLTPDLGRLAGNGSDYLREEYAMVSWWGIALLGGSCGLASLFVPPRWLIRVLLARARARIRTRPTIEQGSAWSRLFFLEPECFVYLQCELDDGTLLAGTLFSFSPQIEESADRELVLSAPEIRREGDVGLQPLDASAVSIASRTIRYMAVTYLTQPPGQP